MRSIMAGGRPRRPDHPGFTEQIWALTQRCWDKEAESRPEIQEVVKALGKPSAFSQPWDHLARTADLVVYSLCLRPGILLISAVHVPTLSSP